MKFIIDAKYIIIGLLVASNAGAKELVSLDEALRRAYPEAGAVFSPQSLTLSSQERKSLEAELGSKIFSSACQFFRASLNGKALGVALLDDEIGKHLPMTILVALGPDSKVKRVELINYRERYGQGVESRKFMAQFENKDGRDSLVLGKGIDAVTGATISSKSIALGVRKALKVADKFKEKN